MGFIDLKGKPTEMLSKPLPEPIWLSNDFSDLISTVATDGNHAYCVTSIGSPSVYWRLVKIDLTKPDRSNWVEILSDKEFQKYSAVQNIVVADDKFLVLYYRDGWSRMTVYSLTGQHISDVKMPGNGLTKKIDGDRNSVYAFYEYTEPFKPMIIYKLDMRTLESTVWLRPREKGNKIDLSWIEVD